MILIFFYMSQNLFSLRMVFQDLQWMLIQHKQNMQITTFQMMHVSMRLDIDIHVRGVDELDAPLSEYTSII